jgi:benzodiazapine receptor
MTRKNYLKMFVAVVICLLAGFIGSFFTTPAIGTWYATLAKPSFGPPNWIFAPVWTILFVLMGLALYLVWSRGLAERKNKTAFCFFLVHLVFNILWSVVFFGLHNPGLAFLVIVALWLMIAYLILNFYRIKKAAGWLLLPYLLWVSFATLLNFAIWQLN